MHDGRMTWATAIYGGTALVFAAAAVKSLRNLRWVRRLPSASELRDIPANVSCSIVIAARDEEARIENTVRRLLAQNGVDLEVVVVDDRSRDGTTEILRGLASEDSRLQIKRIDALPEGWLGKCYACHVGAAAAKGEWILFTDADCWMKPDVISRAVAVAQRESVDHITMCPGTVVESVWAMSWHLMFLTSLVGWIAGVNRDRPGAHMGIGAFNLVRASVYREMGGYEKLRLTVLDDVRFGLLVRRVGKRTRAFLGAGDVECHWGATIGQMIKIMEKNYFAAVDFHLAIVIIGTIATFIAVSIVIAGLFSGTWVGVAPALALIFGTAPAAILARRIGLPILPALMTPSMVSVMWYSLVNSTFVTLRRGGVRWRDTFYSLETLRAGMVRSPIFHLFN
jgi:cellulose synthase/poly-beta-1,6-N-acetylglucosamine synthase-like glycosyltransferase